MEKREICAIIKACAEAGVVNFKFADLEISFAGTKIPEPHQLMPNAQTELSFEENTEELEKSTREFSNEDIAQLQLETLMLTNPELYEEITLAEKAKYEN